MLNYQNSGLVKKELKKIQVFYHLFIPDTNNMWIWWVDEQMSLLKKVGLSEVADINMCITLPLGLVNQKTGHSYDDVVVEYINDRYPFVNIIDQRSTTEQINYYEGQTLSKLYEHCIENDGYVFYFHNKGMLSYTTHIAGAIKDWRHYMQYFNIEKWQECIDKLDEGYDCVGVDWVERHDIKLDFVVQHYAGNFWWARNDYIRKLKYPLAIEEYVDVESMMEELKNYRYCFELWMATGNPNKYCAHYRRHHQYNNQGLERYFIYYPREMYDETLRSDAENKAYQKLHTLTEIQTNRQYTWRDHRNFADWLVRFQRAETIVDLNVDYGYSSFCFALPGKGHVYAIDTFEDNDRYDYVLKKKEELDTDNVTVLKYDDNLHNNWDKQIGILNLNGLRSYEEILNEYSKWKIHLSISECVILIHGTTLDQFGAKRFYDEFDMPKLNFEHCGGLGVLTFNTKMLEMIKNAFGEFIK